VPPDGLMPIARIYRLFLSPASPTAAEGRYLETLVAAPTPAQAASGRTGRWIACHGTGAWAFGQRVEGILPHGGFVPRRAVSPPAH
jgi:hypothetical protein